MAGVAHLAAGINRVGGAHLDAQLDLICPFEALDLKVEALGGCALAGVVGAWSSCLCIMQRTDCQWTVAQAMCVACLPQPL